MSEIKQDPESEQEKKKSKIALVIEDPHLQDLISLILIGEDFSIVAFSNQNDAIARMEKEMPDLILCDFHSPGINGLDVCRVLRKNFLFRYIPVIFLMPDAEQLNKAKLVYAGADDYIDKPSVEAEVVLKIRLNLYRVARQQDINPITSLPGEASLIKELEARIRSEKLFSLFYCDLHNFKLYNQRYGFKRGDDILRFTSSLIQDALKELGTTSDFIAHPQGDEFVFISSHESVDKICQTLIHEFDSGVISFYDFEDKQRGHIMVKNRKGDVITVPFVRMHIGVTTNEFYKFINPAQVIQIAAELKDFAQKSFNKSMFVKERRKKYPFS